MPSASATSSTPRATAPAPSPRPSSGNAISARTEPMTTCVSGSWNRLPAVADSAAGPWSRVSSPPQRASPANVPPWTCGTMPAAARRSVDFPAADPPASTTNSPGSMRSVTSRSAGSRAPGYA